MKHNHNLLLNTTSVFIFYLKYMPNVLIGLQPEVRVILKSNVVLKSIFDIGQKCNILIFLKFYVAIGPKSSVSF